jgi:hypothetical protein
MIIIIIIKSVFLEVLQVLNRSEISSYLGNKNKNLKLQRKEASNSKIARNLKIIRKITKTSKTRVHIATQRQLQKKTTSGISCKNLTAI